MRALAQRGDTVLVALNGDEGDGVVVNLRSGETFPPLPVQSILAWGYWRPFEGDSEAALALADPDAVTAAYVEEQHPRNPAGSERGGEWRSKSAIGGGPVVDDAHVYPEIDEYVETLRAYMDEKHSEWGGTDVEREKAYLVERYKAEYEAPLALLKERLADFPDVRIEPEVNLDYLSDPEHDATASFQVHLETGNEFATPTVTVWDVPGTGIELEDVLDIDDRDFFRDLNESTRYAEMLDAIRGVKREGYVRLYRGMSGGELAAWERGAEIPAGKFFTSKATSSYAMDIPGEPPELHSFKVAAEDVIETDAGTFQLRRNARLREDGAIAAAAWDPARHPRHPAGSTQGGEFMPIGTRVRPAFNKLTKREGTVVGHGRDKTVLVEWDDPAAMKGYYSPGELKALTAAYVEAEHPRDPGGEGGGRWIAKGTSAADEGAAAKKGTDEDEGPPEKGKIAEEILGPYENTQQMLSTMVKGERVYTPERTRFHDRLMIEATDGAVAPEGEPVTLFLAGGSGSGKTSSLDTLPDIAPKSVMVNPDLFKERLPEYQAMRDGGDPYAGWGAHEESSDLAARLTSESYARGLNVIVDGTGDGDEGKFLKKIRTAQSLGRDVHVRVVDIDVETAIERATKRAADPASSGYGRVIPEKTIRSIHRSVAANFDSWKGEVDNWEVYDNSSPNLKDKPRLLGRRVNGGKPEVVDEVGWKRWQRKVKGDDVTAAGTLSDMHETAVVEAAGKAVAAIVEVVEASSAKQAALVASAQMAGEDRLGRAMEHMGGLVASAIERAGQAPPIQVDVHTPEQVAPQVTVNVPEQAAPQVHVDVAAPEIPAAEITVNVPEQAAPQVTVNVPERGPARKHIDVERDPVTGRIAGMTETEE